jgi:hypothetical protein
MTEREQKIRELIARLLARPGISREYTILNVDDAEFLLAELARLRTQLEAPF